MTVGYLYPWDVTPDAPARFREWGFDTVAMATAYHGVRAATPRDPARRFVDTAAALHRPLQSAFEEPPDGPAWTDDPDPVATATRRLGDAGIAVLPWIVLTHSSVTGGRRPDWCAVSALGDRYRWALCPSHPSVRAHAAALAASALAPAGVPWGGVVLEACGSMGAQHGGPHEKTDGAYDPATMELLSVCCCVACAAGRRQAGIDPDRVTTLLRAAVLDAAGGPAPSADDALGSLAEPVITLREAATAALVDAVLPHVRAAAPEAPVYAHSQPHRWATGAAPALTDALAAATDTVVVPAWAPGGRGAAAVTAVRARGLRAAPYVTVLPPVDPAALPGHHAELFAAGADELHVYHLGLAPRDREKLLSERAP